MSRMKYLILFGVFIILMFSTSACDVIFPPPLLELNVVPVYTGAERMDPSENSIAADKYRQDQKWIVSGHKAAVNAYVLPKGTSIDQVKAFYASRLSQLGRVEVITGYNNQFGDLEIDRGMQIITIHFDATSESPSPILLIENYIVNGCTKGGAGCTPGPLLVHTCPPGLELKTVTSSRPSSKGNGTVYTSSDYCYDSAGKRTEPLNTYATPTAP